MNLHPRLHRERQFFAACFQESPLIALLLGLLVPMLVACATVDAMSRPYIGAPHPPATEPAHVAILREPPTQAHDGLGEVVVDASTQPAAPIEQIEDKLRTEAAKMGADAIVVVIDRIQPIGVYVYGPWSADPVLGRRVIGVAIKYRT
jgi:hypothetical protein